MIQDFVCEEKGFLSKLWIEGDKRRLTFLCVNLNWDILLFFAIIKLVC